MIFSSLRKSPEKTLSIAMMLVAVGMMMIVFGILWPRLSFVTAAVEPGWSDFLRGGAYGIGIGIECGGVVLAILAARARAQKP